MADLNNNMERELGWDDTIEHDSTFTLLPAGDYDFRVITFERGRHNPGPESKLPPCNKAVLTIEVSDGAQRAEIRHNLFLHSRCEGMLCEFFTGIGQRQHGEQLRMNWNAVPGSRGRCKLGVREYKGNQYNEIKRFYEQEGKGAQTGAAYQPGKF